jgi:hypothetical protein
VEQCSQLWTHDDIPGDIRQQLYAEEQKQSEQKATNFSLSNLPPINITNVLPGPSHQPFASTSLIATPLLVAPPITPLVVPSLRDTAVKEYSN